MASPSQPAEVDDGQLGRALRSRFEPLAARGGRSRPDRRIGGVARRVRGFSQLIGASLSSHWEYRAGAEGMRDSTTVRPPRDFWGWFEEDEAELEVAAPPVQAPPPKRKARGGSKMDAIRRLLFPDGEPEQTAPDAAASPAPTAPARRPATRSASRPRRGLPSTVHRRGRTRAGRNTGPSGVLRLLGPAATAPIPTEATRHLPPPAPGPVPGSVTTAPRPDAPAAAPAAPVPGGTVQRSPAAPVPSGTVLRSPAAPARPPSAATAPDVTAGSSLPATAATSQGASPAPQPVSASAPPVPAPLPATVAGADVPSLSTLVRVPSSARTTRHPTPGSVGLAMLGPGLASAGLADVAPGSTSATSMLRAPAFWRGAHATPPATAVAGPSRAASGSAAGPTAPADVPPASSGTTRATPTTPVAHSGTAAPDAPSAPGRVAAAAADDARPVPPETPTWVETTATPVVASRPAPATAPTEAASADLAVRAAAYPVAAAEASIQPTPLYSTRPGRFFSPPVAAVTAAGVEPLAAGPAAAAPQRSARPGRFFAAPQQPRQMAATVRPPEPSSTPTAAAPSTPPAVSPATPRSDRPGRVPWGPTTQPSPHAQAARTASALPAIGERPVAVPAGASLRPGELFEMSGAERFALHRAQRRAERRALRQRSSVVAGSGALESALAPQPGGHQARTGPLMDAGVPAAPTTVPTTDAPIMARTPSTEIAAPVIPAPTVPLAERFLHELAKQRRETPQPLPMQFRPLARQIVGDQPVAVASGIASRRALQAVGKEAATTGSVVHMTRRPHTSRRSQEVLAHELTHVAHPSPAPRFFDDDVSSDEEERAEAVARLVTAPSASPAETRATRLGRLMRRSPILPRSDHGGSEQVAAVSAVPRSVRSGSTGAALAPVDQGDVTRAPGRASASPPSAARIRSLPVAPVRGAGGGGIVQRTPDTPAPEARSSGGGVRAEDLANALTTGAPLPIQRSPADTIQRSAAPAPAAPAAAPAEAQSETTTYTSSAAPAEGGGGAESSGGGAAAETTSDMIDDLDDLIRKIEQRVLEQLERRGGRFRGGF